MEDHVITVLHSLMQDDYVTNQSTRYMYMIHNQSEHALYDYIYNWKSEQFGLSKTEIRFAKRNVTLRPPARSAPEDPKRTFAFQQFVSTNYYQSSNTESTLT